MAIHRGMDAVIVGVENAKFLGDETNKFANNQQLLLRTSNFEPKIFSRTCTRYKHRT